MGTSFEHKHGISQKAIYSRYSYSSVRWIVNTILESPNVFFSNTILFSLAPEGAVLLYE